MDIDVDIPFPFPNELSNTQPNRALDAAAARFKGYRLCRRPLQRLMIAGLKQLMKLILDGLVRAGGREDQAKMH